MRGGRGSGFLRYRKRRTDIDIMVREAGDAPTHRRAAETAYNLLKEYDREPEAMNTLARPIHWMAAGCLAAAGLVIGHVPAAAQPLHGQHRPRQSLLVYGVSEPEANR